MFKEKIFVLKKLRQDIIRQEHNPLFKEYQEVIKICEKI